MDSGSDDDFQAEELARKEKLISLKEKDMKEGKGGRGKHLTYKLYIGWQHFSNEKYRVITKTKGGGVRQIDYNADEDLTVEKIIERGTKLYFPQGKSQLGDLKDMDISLGSFAGENLESFMNTDGDPCSFQTYLKSHGLFSSQYHLYIRTKQKSEFTSCASEDVRENVEENMVTDLLVNNSIPGHIELKYKRKLFSRYDENVSTISYWSMRQCYDSSVHDMAYEDYNCITNDDFLLVHVEKDNNLYLTELEDGSYKLCCFTPSAHPEIIMHGPDKIYGINNGDLMLGLLTPLHNKNIYYQWYKDGHLILEGINASVLKVTSPGEYSAGIIVDEQLYKYDVQCSITEHVLPMHTEQSAMNTQIGLKNSVTTISQTHDIQSDSFSTQPYALSSQPPTFTSQSQTFTSQPHIFSSQPQTIISQPQTFTSQPQTFTSLPQTFTSQPQTFTSQPRTFTSQPQTFTSQPQTFTSQPQTFTSQPQIFTSQPKTSSPQPQTFTSQQQTSSPQPQTFTSRPQTSSPQPQTFSSQTQTFTSQPQTFTSQTQTFTSQPQSFITWPQTFTSHPQTFTSQPQTFTSQPQTSSPQPQTFTSQPQTSSPQPQTFSSQTQTFTSQPQTFTSQPQNFITWPQTFITQPQTFISQSQTFTSEIQTFNSQSQACTQSDTKTSLQQPSTQLPWAFDTLSCTVPKVNLADVNLGEEIGRGGFGIVYKGLWIGTKVAIKEIRIKRIKVAKPLVDRELCVHSQLRHPNIVMLMAFALEKDRLYLISELIDGLTLDNCLFGNDAMCMYMSVKLNVSLMVSQAIAYLHAQNPMIIHRDIKPENILVANNFGVVKLCDMGISKLKTMNTVTTTMAGVCLQPGTPAYQAPEILLNRQSANEMTDIWSLACTLVEIFNELPVWNTSDEPVMYIMNKMKLQAKPDGLEVLAALADTYNENVESKIYNLLNKGLSYNDC